jgi:hypothetical protein
MDASHPEDASVEHRGEQARSAAENDNSRARKVAHEVPEAEAKSAAPCDHRAYVIRPSLAGV